MRYWLKKTTISAPIISAGICLLVISLYNISFWQQLRAVTSLPMLISSSTLLFSCFYAALTLISFKYLYKPVILIMVLIAALSAYAMDHFGFIISAQAFQSIVETHQSEVQDFLSWKLVVSFTILFAVPALLLLATKIQYPSAKTICLNLILCLIILLVNVVLLGGQYTVLIRNARHIRYYINPVRPIYALTKFTVLQFGAASTFLELDPFPTRLSTSTKPKLVILVVGESDRAANQSLNGYAKITNPLLAQRDIYSFNNFYSCGTETLVSVPCMFAAFTREEYTQHKGRYTENVLDLLHKSKVQVLWLDNNGGCKHVCDRIPNQDFTSHGRQDEVLLNKLDQYLDPNYGDKLIVLHKIGNHGPAYYKRYPAAFKQFTPTCDTNELQQCNKQQIVNTYDNIILYTDYFLDQIIQKLENTTDYQTALIYVSDHGESLGENGLYLHAMPYWLAPKEQTHVPFFFWASQDFAVDRVKLQQIQRQHYSHDNIFHTLLGIFNVQTKVYKAELDMLI